MKTKIVITLNGNITEEKLKELMGEIEATCSEDSSGSSWAELHNVESTVEEDSEEFYQFVSDSLSDWGSNDLRQWIIDYGPLGGFTETYRDQEKE